MDSTCIYFSEWTCQSWCKGTRQHLGNRLQEISMKKYFGSCKACRRVRVIAARMTSVKSKSESGKICHLPASFQPRPSQRLRVRAVKQTSSGPPRLVRGRRGRNTSDASEQAAVSGPHLNIHTAARTSQGMPAARRAWYSLSL